MFNILTNTKKSLNNIFKIKSDKEHLDYNEINKNLDYFIKNQLKLINENFSPNFKSNIFQENSVDNLTNYQKTKKNFIKTIENLNLSKTKKKELSYLVSYFSLIPLIPPKTISIDLSDKCNLRCRICNQWKDENRNKKIDFSDIKKIIEDVHNFFPNTLIEFSGQEPMLKKQLLFKALEYGTKKKILMAINTNGTLIKEQDAKELVKFNLNHITLSIDGFKETHNYIRNSKSAFDSTIKALYYLVEAKKNKQKPVISVTFVITKKNYTEILDFYDFLNELSVDTLNLNPFTLDNSYFFKKNATYENNEFWLNNKKVTKLKTIIIKLIDKKNKGELPLITNTEKQLKMIPLYFKNKEKYHKRICLAGLNYFHVTNFGEITVCGKGPKLNIRDYDLNYIWNSQNFLKTRLSVRNCKTPCLNNCFELI